MQCMFIYMFWQRQKKKQFGKLYALYWQIFTCLVKPAAIFIFAHLHHIPLQFFLSFFWPNYNNPTYVYHP